MLAVKTARYLDDYKIELAFNDGHSGIADLKEVLANDHRAPFLALQNIDEFRKFAIKHQTIVWENGLDLAPEFLFFLAFKEVAQFQIQFEKWGYKQ